MLEAMGLKLILLLAAKRIITINRIFMKEIIVATQTIQISLLSAKRCQANNINPALRTSKSQG
jgi:hypothetical protein